MPDYMEPSLAFYQGGTICEGDRLGFGLKFHNGLPEWLVITRDAWNAANDEMRSRWEIISSRRGWAYALQGRVVEVMIVRKKHLA